MASFVMPTHVGFMCSCLAVSLLFALLGQRPHAARQVTLRYVLTHSNSTSRGRYSILSTTSTSTLDFGVHGGLIGDRIGCAVSGSAKYQYFVTEPLFNTSDLVVFTHPIEYVRGEL